ncbi:hypothetical protein BDV95DRAFT_139134 [Massariosphaeria phaeospora]|uniref:Uncharacterized protein n=1 Tax=Massariosphaeria phaeospora TaxID=100035 RepID=A0A7C8IPC7_9PLEO|nr:hypothetical protein BDV95DRAFT_139134 [Massariosphaeria phaeospora]
MFQHYKAPRLRTPTANTPPRPAVHIAAVKNLTYARTMAEFDCKFEYHFQDSPFNPKSIGLSILIVILTVITEVTARSFPFSGEDHNHHATADVEAPATTTTVVASAQQQQRGRRRILDGGRDYVPSAHARKIRLTYTTLLMLPLCIAFAFRVMGMYELKVRPECLEYLSSNIYPSWPLFAIFSVLPFACASTAWLGALVDIILAQSNRSLPRSHKEHTLFWPPLLPVLLPVLTVARLGGCARRNSGKSGVAQRIELRAEEGRGVGAYGTAQDYRQHDAVVLDSPPAYEIVVGSTGVPVEGKAETSTK